MILGFALGMARWTASASENDFDFVFFLGGLPFAVLFLQRAARPSLPWTISPTKCRGAVR
jgi:hypothetical protein